MNTEALDSRGDRGEYAPCSAFIYGHVSVCQVVARQHGEHLLHAFSRCQVVDESIDPVQCLPVRSVSAMNFAEQIAQHSLQGLDFTGKQRERRGGVVDRCDGCLDTEQADHFGMDNATLSGTWDLSGSPTV